MSENNDVMMVDDLVDELSEERMLLALFRAAKTIGLDVSWNEDMGIDFHDDDLDFEELQQDENFIEAFKMELKKMVADDLLRGLAHEGEIEPGGVDAEGNVVYFKTVDA